VGIVGATNAHASQETSAVIDDLLQHDPTGRRELMRAKGATIALAMVVITASFVAGRLTSPGSADAAATSSQASLAQVVSQLKRLNGQATTTNGKLDQLNQRVGQRLSSTSLASELHDAVEAIEEAKEGIGRPFPISSNTVTKLLYDICRGINSAGSGRC
jgi:hypothetical protein